MATSGAGKWVFARARAGVIRSNAVSLVILLAGSMVPAAPREGDPPPFRAGHDAPLAVAERRLGDAPNHTHERIEFNGIEGDRIPAFVYVPKIGPAKHPAVLLQYGSGGNKSTNYIVALAKQFVARGFVVLTIDVPNRGERRANGPRGSIWAGLTRPGTFVQTLGDYSRAIDYLSSRADVDTDRIGYAGISLGAITGITFVAHEPRVRAMASVVGGGNLLGMLKVEIDPAVRKTAERIDPFYHVAQIAPRPLLLMNATRDQLVPRFFSEQLHHAAGEHATKVWVDTDHFLQGVDRFAVLETVIDFMEESLEAPVQ